MPGRKWARREFLAGLGRAALLGAASPALVSALAGCARGEGVARVLGGFFPSPEGARRVGEALLRGPLAEQSAPELAAGMAGEELGAWERLAESEPAALFAAVRVRHREDFAADRVVSLHGWVLSRTEAQLCALAALG